MKKAFFFLLGIFGLFILFGAGQIFFQISFQIFNRTVVQYYWFWLGLGTYLLVFLLFRQVGVLYIFGHELTHAIAGLFFGADLRKFRVRKNSGEVVLSKNNLFITLAPYFLPVYTVLVLAGFKLGHYFRPRIVSHYGNIFLFLMGLTLSFHLLHTAVIIFSKQSDWNYAGYFFSVIFVLLANIFVIMLVMKILFPQMVPLRLFFQESVCRSKAALEFTITKGQKLWMWLSAK